MGFETTDFDRHKEATGASLSDRLKAVCQAVKDLLSSEALRSLTQVKLQGQLCDVGCDHALVPITLLETGLVHKAIGLDVNTGPLERAEQNMRAHGISAEQLELRRSDGLQALAPGEAEIVVIAGMGGLLIKEILEQVSPRALGILAFVLSPHTKQGQLREYLRTRGFFVLEEREVCDDGKFYPVISVLPPAPDEETAAENGVVPMAKTDEREMQRLEALQKALRTDDETVRRLSDMFGGDLLYKRDKTLQAYLLKRAQELGLIIGQLQKNGHDAGEALASLTDVQTALKLWSQFDSEYEGGCYALQ